MATDDVFSIFISEGNDNGNLTTGARRITVNCKGLVGFDTYDGGNWLSADAAGVVVSSLNDGSIDDDSDSDNGWLSEIAVPLSELGIKVAGGASGDVRKCAEDYLAGKLESDPDFHCGCHDGGGEHSCGGGDCRHGHC